MYEVQMDLLFLIPQTSLAGMFATSIISSALNGGEDGKEGRRVGGRGKSRESMVSGSHIGIMM
jgi:hypothetical protein